MRYPNGKVYRKGNRSDRNVRPVKKAVRHGKRGMKLETMLNKSNQYYLDHEKAVIHKKPTPIQVVKVDYPKRSCARITEAYYRQPSTTDYNGVYKGYYIDYEAKQTRQVTSFPLRNFHPHQLRHMNACHKQGGISFVIIYFSQLDRAFLYPFQTLAEDWYNFQAGGPASIPLTRIEEQAYEIPIRFQPPLDYLPCLDNYIKDYTD